MKKFIFLLPIFLIFCGCDNIGPDDRYTEVDEIVPVRRVLLEEFTGQRCTNCPAAHAIIESLEEQYGDNLIVVSIHAGEFGIAAIPGDATNWGLMQPVGDIYAKHWKVNAYPAGVIDRTGGVLKTDEWATALRLAMVQPTDVEIDLSADLSADGSINIKSYISSSKALNAKLQLWIVENDIVTFQIDEGERLYDYVHNNVLRACVNGDWGTDISLAASTDYTFENSILRDEVWNPDNLYVVGFVYDDSGVLEAAKTKINN